jgi:hypothetical protein
VLGLDYREEVNGKERNRNAGNFRKMENAAIDIILQQKVARMNVYAERWAVC